MLGNTSGVKGRVAYPLITMTAVGESNIVAAFFPGKPLVGNSAMFSSPATTAPNRANGRPLPP